MNKQIDKQINYIFSYTAYMNDQVINGQAVMKSQWGNQHSILKKLFQYDSLLSQDKKNISNFAMIPLEDITKG